MERLLIVIAAGNGSRLGASLPKVFIPLNNQQSLFDIIITLKDFYSKIIIVLSKSGIELAKKYALPDNLELCQQNNADGVKQALEIAVNNCNLNLYSSVTLQWGDQPFVTNIYRNIFIEKLSNGKILIPLVLKEKHYVCFNFEKKGLIILEKRENEVTPQIGFKDIGFFIFSPSRLQDLIYLLNSTPVYGVVTNEVRFLKTFEILHANNFIEYTIDFPSYFEIGFNTKDELELVKNLYSLKNNKICI
jgi:bifunctional N-acetylglucosamine-1-phosphate-uridyltransferase/glucosamine-1-phosphate-acetyltransferase GlmU-like protein